MIKVKRFGELKDSEIDLLVDVHYNHWVHYNPAMEKENTIYKFTKLYTKNELPYGLALFDDDNIVGFCVLKIDNLKKYPDIYPWLSDVMILEQFRGMGYGRILISYGEQYLKEQGFKTIYVWTDQAPDFYRKLGFKYKQEVEKNEGGYGQLFYKDL